MSLDTILDTIEDLSIEDKEELDEILHKRIIEEKREQIYNDYQKDLKDYQEGNVKTGTVKDLLNGIS